MARVTVEDCLENIDNRFALVILAAQRARQLLKGATPTVDAAKNKAAVTALREIAAGHVWAQRGVTLPNCSAGDAWRLFLHGH